MLCREKLMRWADDVVEYQTAEQFVRPNWPAWTVIVGAIIVLQLVYYVYRRLWSSQGLPRDVPWAGAGNSRWLRGKSSLKSIFRLQELLMQGYRDYSKRAKPFILPNIFTGHEFILPPSQMHWLLTQPPHILNQHETLTQFLCAEYTLPHPTVFAEGRMATNVRRNLTRLSDEQVDSIVDEISRNLDSKVTLGPYGWHEIALYDVMLDIVARSVSRVLVGPQLCRDEAYVYHSSRVGRFVPLIGAAINLFPSMIRPLAGFFLTISDKRHYSRMLKAVTPVVHQRLLALQRDPCSMKEQQPNDYIQWTLVDTLNRHNPSDATPEMIATHLVTVNLAAIQSTAAAITNALFDIAASEQAYTIQNALKHEAYQLTEKPEKESWKRPATLSLPLADSTLRESLRLRAFSSRGVTKVVVAKDGVTLPTGHHLPFGSYVGIPSYGPHHDPEYYSNPCDFDPFRHRQTAYATNGQSLKGMVNTGESFLAFSHGRYACPGRFFAAHQLKALLLLFMAKYEIEPLERRPENQWFNNVNGPNLFATVKVRHTKRI